MPFVLDATLDAELAAAARAEQTRLIGEAS